MLQTVRGYSKAVETEKENRSRTPPAISQSTTRNSPVESSHRYSLRAEDHQKPTWIGLEFSRLSMC
ncbi:hypothetical protein BDN71DRAFT_1454713 [Pleurotus eryngii]|uniref:Uncharacterized protein n=1 Tax=Pleurotus eryngii TaxID=5323 RepID=A0A9P6DC90_PLEER|nr:hypothetical protein BDN71DRAFT_1454713 [Pleurotus eryngii]